MKTSDFSFELPEHLVAQYPGEQRGQSKLMTLDRITGKRAHRSILELPDILCGEFFLSPSGEKPLLVFNDTKVRKARLIGKNTETGAEVEFLLIGSGEKRKEKREMIVWKTLVQKAKRRKIGSRYTFFDTDKNEVALAEITGEDGEFRILKFDCLIDDEWLDKYGHVPLPPYIKRKDSAFDAERYQTIYAKQTGSAAAPTAGLHFTSGIFDKLAANGIESVFITLHVGLGTFLPVRSENLTDHKMHSETFIIDDKTALKIESAKAAGRKIIAVGTTSVRTLESAWTEGKLKRGEGSTSIFIYPGFNFKVIDAMFTNFHTPQSTLLMLVCAFANRELILESYREAIQNEYRFFSYGDAMLIT
ncbi:MAG: tRNA preQ1(34) S-adenosylmethionine ribosyltransferase-isomerase QueA [Treponema sp.]|jgi:S-adenosylmethionine:tRNA ribosyltransferase-isomerase|nr:tRNA preQ1(34) S-adenosylmethionine ribosyltransferase-isomerase QueA [Treponema sp.]